MEITDTTNRSQVTLLGKIHDASPTRWTRDGAGQKVAHPVCGQRSRNWFPSYLTGEAETTCEKCLAARPAPAPEPATSSPTAVRHTDGKGAYILVTFADRTTRTVAGARAARAGAVLIVDQGGRRPKVMCRADAAAAAREAHTRSTATTMTGNFGTGTRQTIPCTPEPTVAIPVTDA